VRFIGNKESHKASRFFWAASLILSIIALTYNFWNAFNKWNYEPDIGLSAQQKFLNEIPFPAVTVCSPVWFKDGLANFEILYEAILARRKFPNLTVSEQNYIAAGLQWCDSHLASQYLSALSNRTQFDVIKLLDETSLKIDELLVECSFKRKLTGCKRMWNRVITDKSFCFSFNMQGFRTIFNEGKSLFFVFLVTLYFIDQHINC
jgi:Amiloride-sensitive sodium channel